MGQLCPSNVQFTCTTVRLPTIRWFVNGDQIVVHSHYSGASYPRVLPVSDRFSNFTIVVEATVILADDSDNVAFVSTLDTNLLTLSSMQVHNIKCGSISVTTSVNISFTFKGTHALCVVYLNQAHACIVSI